MISLSRFWPLAVLLACLSPLAAASAKDDTSVPVRIGTHQGYGRVVFDLPSRIDYRVTQEGQHVLVQFTGDVTVGEAHGVPRNVVSINGGAARAEFVIAAGTVLHSWRLGDMVDRRAGP